MYVGAYRFAGDPSDLVAAYDRMISDLPTATFDLHVCIVQPDGIVVLDGCPTEAIHLAFSTSPELHGACARAGLPVPTIEHLGEVHRSFVNQVAPT